jgi:hypothetical protein
MKTFKLSIIALCLFGTFTSCTKDSLQTSTASTASIESVSGNSGRGGTEIQPAEPGSSQGGGQQNGTLGGNGNNKTTATVDFTVSPATASLNETVTINGTITLADPADQFVYEVEISTKYANGTWTAFESTGYTGNVNLDAPQTISSKTFNFSFLGSVLGAGEYRLRIHVGGQDVENMFSDVKTLTIKNCQALKAEGKLMDANSLGNNMYRFTVTYTVTSCPEMGAAKLQGGLTAFSSVVNSYDGSEQKGFERKETNNSNFIYYWMFNISGNYSNTFTMVFEKEIKEEGLQNITGAWSVSAKDPSTGDEVRVDIPPVTFTK